MDRVMGWVFTALSLIYMALAVARMLGGDDATVHIGCGIACSAMAGVYSIREEMSE